MVEHAEEVEARLIERIKKLSVREQEELLKRTEYTELFDALTKEHLLRIETEQQRDDLLAACEAQHEAIDRLFAMLIECKKDFFPSKSGQPWKALNQGNAAIAKAKELK